MRNFVVSENIRLNEVKVGLTFFHEYRDDLTIKLTSPAGTQVGLIDAEASGPSGSNVVSLNVRAALERR